MSVDKTEAIKAIQTLYGLKEAEAEKKLATLSDAEISKLISNYKKDLDMGVSVQKAEKSPVLLSDYDNQTYTDDEGNAVTEYFDGDNVVERIIKDKDGNQTTVTYRNNRPFTQIKNIQGNIEKSKFEYHDDADEPFVMVETTKADKTKVTTNTQSITENGDIIEDYIKDRKTVKPDGTTITLTPKIIDLKSPTNDKKTFFKGECMEEVVETFNGKKRTTYFEGSNFDTQGRRILTQTSDNTVYYNSDNKPVYNHKEYVKKQQKEAYNAEYEKRMERTIPLKGSHTNVLSGNNVTLGKAENVTVKDFITNILGIDINSETGKKLADRFVRLPESELEKISYADYEAQTLGLGKYAPKTNDYSGMSFSEIARDLRLQSGVNIETQDEITQHKIQMTIQENVKKQRENELGITAKKQAAELLTDMNENAANMYESYYLGSSHLHKIADLLFGYATGNDDAGRVRKYREQAQDFKQLGTLSNDRKLFEEKFKALTGKDYDEKAVKDVIDNVQSYSKAVFESFKEEFKDKKDEFKKTYGIDYSDDAVRAVSVRFVQDYYSENSQFKILCKRAFGFAGSKEVKDSIEFSAGIDNLGELAAVFATMSLGGTLQSVKAFDAGTNMVSKQVAGNVSKFAGNTAGKIAGFMPKVVNSAVKMDVASYTVNLANTGDTNSALQAGISGAEMGAAGALIGATAVRGTQILTDKGLDLLISDARVMSKYMKAIPKPSEKTANAVNKLFGKSEEVNAQTFMETVIENQGPSIAAHGTGFIAEVLGFETYNIIMNQLKNEIDPATGKLPPKWDEAFTFNYFKEHFKDKLKNLGNCKAVSKLVMFAMGAKNVQQLAVQDALNSSKSLRGMKVREIKAGEQTGYELTMPDGKKAYAADLKQASGYFNYLMQLDMVSDAANDQPQTEWKKIKIGGEEVEVAVVKGAKGVKTADFNKARKLNANGEYEEFKLKPKNDLLSSESDKPEELTINTDTARKNIEKFAQNLDDKGKTEIFDAANKLFSNPNMRNGVVDTIIGSCIEEQNGVQTFNKQAFDEINKLFETHRKAHPYMSDFTYSLRIAEITKSGVRKEYDAKGNYKKTFDATNFKIAQLFDECDSNVVHVDFSYTTDKETGLIDVSALPQKFRNYILNNLPKEMKDNVNKIPQEIFDKSTMTETLKSFGFEEKNGYLVSGENLTDKINDTTNIAGGGSKVVLDKEDLETLHKMINLGNHKDFWRKLDEPEMIVMFLRFKNLFTFHKPPIIETKGPKFWDRIIYDIQNNKPTEAERDALGDFVGDGYGYINRALSNAKNNKPYDSYYMNEAENLASLIDKHTADEDINLTRVERNPERFSDIKLQDGTSLSDILMNFDKYRDNLDEINKELQGKVIENERFMSATVRQGNDLPMQGLVWEMNLKKGSKAIFRNTYTDVNTGEIEYIVQKNSNIIIKGIELDWRGLPRLKAEVSTEKVSKFDVLSAEADNVTDFDEINAMRKKVSLAKLEDKSQEKALFAKLKNKEQDLRENSILLKLGTKAGDDIDKHNQIKEFTRNSNVTTAIISTKTNNITQFFEIKISVDEQGNIVSKTKTELKNYKPKPKTTERKPVDYSYGYSEDRTAYDGGMSESAFDAFRMRMYPDLFGTYEVKDKVVKGERNPVYKSLEHLETGNNRKPINLAPLGKNSVRGRNLLTLSYDIFKEAKEKGIKRLIDLRAEAKTSDGIKEIDGKKYIDDVQYVHIPMDYSAGECDPELIRNMSEFFEAMDKGNVYIGCNLGSHRTDFAIAINYALNTNTKEASPMLYLNMSDIVSGVHRVYKKIMKMTPEERKANNVSDDLLNILPKNMKEVDERLKRIADVTQEAK